jgi:hypothetical protein
MGLQSTTCRYFDENITHLSGGILEVLEVVFRDMKVFLYPMLDEMERLLLQKT